MFWELLRYYACKTLELLAGQEMLQAAQFLSGIKNGSVAQKHASRQLMTCGGLRLRCERYMK